MQPVYKEEREAGTASHPQEEQEVLGKSEYINVFLCFVFIYLWILE